MQYTSNIETIGKFDLVVMGAGPAGISAAVSAAEMGLSVLLIERAGIVGGCLTVGHVLPVSGGHVKNTMADRINNLLSENQRGTFNVENAKIKLMNLVAEHGITLYLNSSVCDAVTENGIIKSAVISTQSGLKAVDADFFIDATGDAVLAYLAGEQIEYGREDGLVQPMSVMFTISGVKPEQPLYCYHEAMDTPLKKGNYLQLCKDACRSGELPPSIDIVRLYNGSSPDERVVNATQVNRLNPLDPADYTAAQLELRNQMYTVVNFLKNNVEGFEDIKIRDSSDVVGVRESRRVMGQYVLSAEDLITGRRFDDVIVHEAEFAIDIHNPNGSGQAESETTPVLTQPYDIPLRSIVPLVNKNLLTAGRCISGSHRAHASYRVMNIAMNIGEAAGVAAALCLQKGVSNADLDYREVQQALIDRNIQLFD